MIRCLTLMAFGAVIASTPAAAIPVSVAGIEDEQFFTLFNDDQEFDEAGEPLPFNGAGTPYDPTPEQNPIANIAKFGAPGVVGFIQNVPYYLQNPNAWVFSGQTSAEIIFNTAIQSLSLAVRGTSAGDTAGPNGIAPFTAGDGPFAEAEGTVNALNKAGDVIATQAIQNGNLQGDNLNEEIVFTMADLGQDIFGLEFVQKADADNAGIFLGGLGATTANIPLPSTVSLMLLGLTAGAFWRRKR